MVTLNGGIFSAKPDSINVLDLFIVGKGSKI